MKRFAAVLTIAALGAAGIAVAGTTASTHKTKPVTITVVAKDFSFTLSKRTVPVGSTVVFKVVNRGKIGHNFKIAGKTTKLIAPGKSATLTVKFAKKGKYAYLCTVPGHARLGMKGVFGVGVAGGTTTTAATTTGTTGSTTTAVVGNGNTTVTVNMVEYSFQLSQTTVPSGKVTFVIKNSGSEVHNFDLNGQHSGALLSPGETETWTVSLPAGQYLYTCDVPFHVSYGMTGVFTVTP
jgi:uncharacterized cupredoxin-like copper-binding protein